MTDSLQWLDTAVFHFLNGTIGNPVFDVIMPFVTDLNRHWYGWIFYGGAWLLLMTFGGRTGRTAALLLIPVIALGDQLSSSVIKKLVMRPRPCHSVGGLPVVEHVRLLVGCGGGFSFPSSHAVNNFAAATLLSHFYPRKRAWLFGAAGLVAFSRISVGVHYPSDVLGGMIIGVSIAGVCILAWTAASGFFRSAGPPGPSPGGGGRE